MRHRRSLITLLLVLMPLSVSATEDEDDAWFEDDLESRIASVNGGDLVFLTSPPSKPVHHHHSSIVLDANSLNNGWVTVIQCHTHLDAVPRSQVLYHRTRTRDLSILSHENIDTVWIEGHTVQLADVEQGASLCVRVRMRTLESNNDGSFSLRGGPYMRRFLDGYYPMHVSINIQVPRGHLRFVETRPRIQDGFQVVETDDGVYVDAWFEGKLHTEFRFEADSCDQPETTSC